MIVIEVLKSMILLISIISSHVIHPDQMLIDNVLDLVNDKRL